ncbi:maestro heat-like repeat family member 5 [Passer domesticus]|uniref:maestro heat-like repeat family member 5 n=1 Tax=Passer domesticus TaxID=48849 RepID=UPI0030FEF5B3
MAPTEGTASTNSNRRTPRTRAISKTNSTPTWTGIPAPIPDIFSSQQQVAARVGDIHQRLMSRVTADTGLETDFLSLAEEHPANVVMSLLRCAPSCDRAAVLMWRSIGTSRPAVQKVLPALFSVIEDRPLYSMFFYSGDNEAVFALAATVVLWNIAHMPEWHDAVVLHSAQLFVALLFQVFSTTEQIPEEVEDFWRACQEEHRLPTKPNRFAVQAVKALLCQLGFENKLVALECKQVWDTLLCADTQHYAVGLLAR